jgi:uncharacterized protein YcbK (DUF882 family)
MESEADLAKFEQWSHNTKNKSDLNLFRGFLNSERIDDVIPLHQLLRSDTKWRQCRAQPFAVPPRRYWPNMVPTLKLVRSEIIPLTGPVEAQSAFRDAAINGCIKGARHSFHLRFHAIDMKPAHHVPRQQLITKLCRLHREKGRKLNMGLGIYSGTRFHIDTAGYRGWGNDHHSASFPCRQAR